MIRGVYSSPHTQIAADSAKQVRRKKYDAVHQLANFSSFWGYMLPNQSPYVQVCSIVNNSSQRICRSLSVSDEHMLVILCILSAVCCLLFLSCACLNSNNTIVVNHDDNENRVLRLAFSHASHVVRMLGGVYLLIPNPSIFADKPSVHSRTLQPAIT